MTYAADKAKEIATKMPRACAHARYIVVCDACIAAPIAAAISAAVAEERKLNGEARQALADAAREIPMAGPVADRIRALKEQHRANMQAERERAGKMVEAAKAVFGSTEKNNGDVCCGCPFPDLFEAVKAYEVPHE